MTNLEMALCAQRKFNQHMEFEAERVKREMKSPCRARCAWCCHQVVSATLFEAALILQSAEGYEASRWWPVVQKQADDFLARRPHTTEVAWYKAQTPCALLLDGTCSMYSVRPTACRMHIANEGSDCSPKSKGHLGNDPAPYNFKLWDLAEAQSDSIEVPFLYGPLPVVLTWAHIMLSKGAVTLKQHLSGTPFQDPISAIAYWAYVELSA